MGLFSDQLSTFAQQAKDAIDLTVREVVYQVGLTLVRMSPIDTGAFVSNWRYGLETPDRHWSPGQLTVRYVNDMGDMPRKAGNFTHFITNAAPYGPPLERGHSKQAPQGMVVLTTLVFRDIVANAAAKARSGQVGAIGAPVE